MVSYTINPITLVAEAGEYFKFENNLPIELKASQGTLLLKRKKLVKILQLLHITLGIIYILTGSLRYCITCLVCVFTSVLLLVSFLVPDTSDVIMPFP